MEGDNSLCTYKHHQLSYNKYSHVQLHTLSLYLIVKGDKSNLHHAVKYAAYNEVPGTGDFDSL